MRRSQRLIGRRIPTGLLATGLGVLGFVGSVEARSQPMAVAAAPPAVATGLPQVADFNADNIPDLAVANSGNNTVSIFLGTGTGLPASPNHVLTGSGANRLKSPRGIALGDFNGDTKTDIAVTNYLGASVSVFLGNGDGTFQNPTNVAVLRKPLGIAVAQLRGTGQPFDIAVVNALNGRGNLAGRVGVLLGNGNGTFVRAGDFGAGESPRNLVVGDFGTSATSNDLDGNLDLAVTLQGTDNSVSILYGNGSGSFSAPDKRYPAGPAPNGIAALDYDGDGCVDLAVVGHQRTSNEVALLHSRCNTHDALGSFNAAVIIANFGPFGHPFGITAVNLNGDTQPDLAVTLVRTNGVFTGRIALLFNLTPAVSLFSTPLLYLAPDDARGITAGRFNPNTDAIDDLAVTERRSGTVSIFLGCSPAPSCSLTQTTIRP